MSYLVTEKDARGVATITLDRPKQHNAFDDVLIAELTETFQRLDTDATVRVVLLRANGKSFSAGADLNWMRRMAEYSAQENLADAMKLAAMIRILNQLSKPTVARVHGPAYGGGVSLVASCDIAVACSDASFAFTEARLGIIPAVISPYIAAAIGERMMRRYFLSAEVFTAAEAYRIGLVQDLAADEAALDELIASIVQHLLACGPKAQAAAKQLIRDVANRAIDDALVADTAQRIAQLRASEEGREGISAFLEKRKPGWIEK